MDTTALAERLEEMRDSLARFVPDMKDAARNGAMADVAALTEAAQALRAVAGEPMTDPQAAWDRWVSSKAGGDALQHGEVRPYRTHFNAGFVAGFNMRAALESFANKERE